MKALVRGTPVRGTYTIDGVCTTKFGKVRTRIDPTQLPAPQRHEWYWIETLTGSLFPFALGELEFGPEVTAAYIAARMGVAE